MRLPNHPRFCHAFVHESLSIELIASWVCGVACVIAPSQVVTRILLLKFGRFWLIGGSDHTPGA